MIAPAKCKNCTLEEIAVLRVIQQNPSVPQKFVASEIGKSERQSNQSSHASPNRESFAVPKARVAPAIKILALLKQSFMYSTINQYNIPVARGYDFTNY